VDERPVEMDWVRKSAGTEKTFSQDIRDPNVMRAELALLVDDLLTWMEQHRTYGRTLTVKVKYADFRGSGAVMRMAFNYECALLGLKSKL
jgi:DNA polymerase-4